MVLSSRKLMPKQALTASLLYNLSMFHGNTVFTIQMALCQNCTVLKLLLYAKSLQIQCSSELTLKRLYKFHVQPCVTVHQLDEEMGLPLLPSLVSLTNTRKPYYVHEENTTRDPHAPLSMYGENSTSIEEYTTPNRETSLD